MEINVKMFKRMDSARLKERKTNAVLFCLSLNCVGRSKRITEVHHIRMNSDDFKESFVRNLIL